MQLVLKLLIQRSLLSMFRADQSQLIFERLSQHFTLLEIRSQTSQLTLEMNELEIERMRCTSIRQDNHLSIVRCQFMQFLALQVQNSTKIGHGNDRFHLFHSGHFRMERIRIQLNFIQRTEDVFVVLVAAEKILTSLVRLSIFFVVELRLHDE